MADITKKTLVLDISPAIEHATSNAIMFEYREEKTGFVSYAVVMPRKEWSDLGCPMQITASLVPGNQLTKEST